jgi:hypothetical protein
MKSKLILTDQEKEEILNDHIPYKMSQLRNHRHHRLIYKRLIRNDQFYRRHEICAIEIAFVAGRLFLEFLGLSFSKKTNQLIDRNILQADDLYIEHFNCIPVKLSDLTNNEINVLTIFYNRANKGSGHFTWQKREIDGFESVDEGTQIIERLLKQNLYDKLGRELNEK